MRFSILDECCANLPGSTILQHWLESPTRGEIPILQSRFRLAFSSSDPLQSLEKLVQYGFDIDQKEDDGRTPLHLVISESNLIHRIEVATWIIEHGGDVNAKDENQDTPLTLISRILERQEFSLASRLVQVLVEAGADVNHRNRRGWSALAFSVKYLDFGLPISRFLINSGAKIFPDASTEENKPLGVFLRSVLLQQSLKNAGNLLRLLAVSASTNPQLMRALVFSEMISEFRFPNSRGVSDLLLKICRVIEVYWRIPLPLTTLCINQVRRNIGAGQLNSGTLNQMNLPGLLQDYLSLEKLPDMMPKTLHDKTAFNLEISGHLLLNLKPSSGSHLQSLTGRGEPEKSMKSL